MTTSPPSFNDLRKWDNQHVWHPFTPMRAHRDEKVPIIVAGEGCELIDAEGRRYFDGVSSLWCNIHGHRVPALDQAIRDQLDRIAHCTLLGLTHPSAIQLAKRLADLAPGNLNKVFYSDDGATAVEAALKMAVQYHRQRAKTPGNRRLFLCLSDAYHGDTLGAVSVGGVSLFHAKFDGLVFQTLRIPAPRTYRVPEGYDSETYPAYCLEELERLLIENKNEVAGVVMEPLVQGAAGMITHPPGFLTKVRELTKQHNVLLILDEVAVGCGRTGTFFACEQEQVEPDLLCIAKGLTGGYLPVAVTLAQDEIYEAFLGEVDELKTFFHGHTYTGNPLGCAAALASLDLFEDERVLQNVNTRAQQLSTILEQWKTWPGVGDIRQRGLMVGIELVADKDRQTPFDYGLRIGHQVTLAARQRGVIIRPLGNVIVLMPPLVISEDQLHFLCTVVGQSIQEVVQNQTVRSSP